MGGGWFGLAAVAGVLPDGGVATEAHGGWLVWVTAAIPILGIVLGYLLYGRGEIGTEKDLDRSRLGGFLLGGWGFDALYDVVLVKPFVRLAARLKNEPVDWLYNVLVQLASRLHKLTASSETGQLRWYAANMGIGLAFILALAVILL